MKYCIITSSYPANDRDSRNTGVFIKNFAETLAGFGQKVAVVTPEKSGEKEKSPKVSVYFFKTLGNTTELVSINPKNPFGFLKLLSVMVGGIFATLKKVSSFQPNLILACWIVPSGIFALAAYKILKIPYTVWALGSDVWKVKKYPFGEKVFRFVLKNSQQIYANSQTIKERLRSYTDREIIILRSTRALDQNTKGAKVDRQKTNFLMISRFHVDKGPDILLSAFDMLRKIKPDTYLYLFGGGPLEKVLKQQIQNLGLEKYVRLGNYLDAEGVASYLKACDCLVVPSRKESLPVVFSEAAQLNCPTIVTDVGDLGLLAHKYNTGLVAVPNDADDLKNVMLKFIEQKKGDNYQASEELKKEFDINNIVKKFLDVSNS
ncbi:MAG: hypothetical protein COT91_00710 [Candidatus Doudnabacteria bacterium CG10_big_fil_rev_8_21_14_0_10_41_10]|uniref:Glycosyl transferase family 1 domain-containing protein n=1 Tax=Candidatus Doudnabacteria bacterium CG10_big_fil_rev_8_21_14_0_10_41_10 TaxID=1974551 RepID=A0A2H0VES9_9BACT|nr:MAG: hypothetical protein COT91_00710 [Candidatus Doudnabacteria bacterium CG10_big_fil_rev_8_21_14_0_10_41_10]